jgi:hypothetical protein
MPSIGRAMRFVDPPHGMKYQVLVPFLLVIFLSFLFPQKAAAQGKGEGKVDWVGGYISGVGVGTATPSGNKVKDELRAVRAATVLGQRALLETIKGVRIDSQKKIQDRMTQEEVINTRIEGTIQGAQIVKQSVRWENERPIATVELRVCLGGFGACEPEKSIIGALALDHKAEPSNVPRVRLADTTVKQEKQTIQEKSEKGIMPQRPQEIAYDSSKPVTGVVFALQGMVFERVILPVIITMVDDGNPITVYSVKSVEPQVVRTYGAIRYADTVDQAKQNQYLGDNVIVVPVSDVTSENMIVIAFSSAKIIRETMVHGNDYLKNAKAVIAAR